MKKVWITVYDVFSAEVACKANVDAILVGDSLGMTVYGFENTTLVTKEIMRLHFEAVQKKAPNMRIVLDIPYGCDANSMMLIETLEFFAEKGATEYKLELHEDNFSALLEARSRGYTMVAHLGYLPQSEKTARVVGRTDAEADKIFQLAKKADAIGVSSIVLECVPETLTHRITNAVSCEIIGIGAGNMADGQVLVFDDVIGKTSADFTPKFLRRFGDARTEIFQSVQQYADAVRSETFPNANECYE